MHPTAQSETSTLFLAFELSQSTWKLGFTTSTAQKPRRRTMKAGDLGALAQELASAKERFQVAEEAQIVSCFEAGRDGFWLHRYLSEEAGIENLVVDSSSIEVNRRHRRAKTDRLDVESLLRQLLRYQAGERKAFSVVHVPSREAEDGRHLHREMEVLKHDQTRRANRIRGLLATQGVILKCVSKDFPEWLETVRLWDGSALGQDLKARLLRDYRHLAATREDLRTLERQRQEALRNSEDPQVEKIRQLIRLRALGVNSSWLFVAEFFGWREFTNRRQVGGLAGLTPTPYQSGGSAREQGISKHGNARLRAMMIEIAWCWLRFQPQSQLSRWYWERFGRSGTKRMRRVGIVALARKLLVALWRYLDQGVLPEGAVLKA